MARAWLGLTFSFSRECSFVLVSSDFELCPGRFSVCSLGSPVRFGCGFSWVRLYSKSSLSDVPGNSNGSSSSLALNFRFAPDFKVCSGLDAPLIRSCCIVCESVSSRIVFSPGRELSLLFRRVSRLGRSAGFNTPPLSCPVFLGDSCWLALN